MSLRKSLAFTLLATTALAACAFGQHFGEVSTPGFKDQNALKQSISICSSAGYDIDEMACDQYGEWVVVAGTHVYHSSQFPSDTLAKINEYIHMGKTIDAVAFTPKDGWMVIAEDQAWRSGSISDLALLEQQVINLLNANIRVKELVFDADNDGWGLFADGYTYMQKMPRDFYEGIADGPGHRKLNRASMGFDGSFCIMKEDWYATKGVSVNLIDELKFFQQNKKQLDRVMVNGGGGYVLYSHGPFSPNLSEGIKKVEYQIAAGSSPTGGTLYKNIWQRMAELNIAGVTIGIIEDNQLKWARGYGEIEKGTQRFVRYTTPFDTASVSKSISSAGMLTYMDDPGSQMHIYTNILDAALYGNVLTNPLFNWIIYGNFFSNVDHVPFNAMTVERLLSHTACLEPWSSVPFLPGQACPSQLQLLLGAAYDNNNVMQLGTGSMVWYNPDILGDGKYYYPGQVTRYSGGGFLVAQTMTEIFTGIPFEKFMQQRIFTPLGMTNSTMVQPLPADFANRAAVPHDSNGNPLAKNKRPYYPWLTAGGVWTTAQDFSQFIITLNQGGKAPNGTQLIAPLYVQEMLKDHTPEPEKFYGFGVSLTGEKVNSTTDEYFAHNGGHSGAATEMAGYPKKKQGLIIMINAGDASAKTLRGELYETFKRVYNW